MTPIFVVTLQDIIGLTLFGIILLVVIIYFSRLYLKQVFCKHSRVYETMACNAICSSCGKNLGFIGNWQDKQKSRNEHSGAAE